MRNSIDYGIDLGTTNSVIARRDGMQTKLFTSPEGERLLPSALHVDAAGNVLVGSKARGMRDLDSDNTAIEFKRLMGTEEKKTFPASGKTMSPEEMSAAVLKTLATWVGGEGVRTAVITVPAMFQLPQCDATRRAAELAGIVHAPLVQEPIAAAIAHCGTGEVKDGSWLVYDLGGGTFDVSLVRSKAGRLQVLDHDGDNHLGGRDFDRLVVRQVAERVRTEGGLGEFKRSDPAHNEAYAKLKMEAERLRIKLTQEDRAVLEIKELGKKANGEVVGVSMEMSRSELEELLRSTIMRTVQLCKKLLSRNGLEAPGLNGLVMVGGPTLTPCVPQILHTELGIEARHVIDPMTIVALGAALFATTQKVPANLRAKAAGVRAVDLQLEYESMTTDPKPFLVGKLAGEFADRVKTVRVVREDGGFDSGPVQVGAKAAFAVALQLQKSQLNNFRVDIFDAAGQKLPATISSFAILHGMSIAKPPLSQSVGIMLADNSVSWYLRKGAPLPARNTMTHTTTVKLERGQSGDAINVPLVQGESDRADRNKVIGVLRIHAEKISRDLPAGVEIDVHLTIDEYSQTTARAHVPLLGQWFDDVVMMRMESKDSAEVGKGLQSQRDRLAALEKMADDLEKEGGGDVDERVSEIESLLEEGDRDSLDLADKLTRDMAQDIDHVESTNKESTIREDYESAARGADELVGALGNDADKKQLAALNKEFSLAMERHDLPLAAAKSEALHQLNMRMLQRTPDYWVHIFKIVASRIIELGLAEKAAKTLARGQQAMRDNSMNVLHEVCIELFQMLPQDERAKVDVPGIVSHLK